MDLGHKIRFLRTESKKTLKEVSKTSCLSVSFLSDIENGRRLPSLDNLQKIAAALQVSADYLLSSHHNISSLATTHKKATDIMNRLLQLAEQLSEEELTETEKYMRFLLSQRNSNTNF